MEMQSLESRGGLYITIALCIEVVFHSGEVTHYFMSECNLYIRIYIYIHLHKCITNRYISI